MSDEEDERPVRGLFVKSKEELETQLSNLLPSFFNQEGTKYSVTALFPLSNEDMSKLATSPLGQVLEELEISIPSGVRFTSNPVLRPKNLTSESKFPKLKKLHLIDQSISAIHFVHEVFPVLEDLKVVLGVCVSFHLNLPTLLHVDFQHINVFGHDDIYDDFCASLMRSPKLESLTSYKLILLQNEYVLFL